MNDEVKVLIIALLGAMAVGAIIALMEDAEPVPVRPRAKMPEPADWEISQLLEEARRILREASG